jgi:hypothetical protein
VVSDARQRCFLYGQIECGESANVVCSVSCENRVAPTVYLGARTASVSASPRDRWGRNSVQTSVCVIVPVSQSAATASQVSAKSNARGEGGDGGRRGHITVSFSNDDGYSSLCYRVMTVLMYVSTNGTICFITYFIS